MPDWITDEEQERIRKFAATPRYERGPHFLEPDEESEGDEEAPPPR